MTVDEQRELLGRFQKILGDLVAAYSASRQSERGRLENLVGQLLYQGAKRYVEQYEKGRIK